MSVGLIGSKLGMSRVAVSDGSVLAVTVISVNPNRVVQVKTEESDGYSSIKVVSGVVKQSRVNRPQSGVFAAAEVEAGSVVREFRFGASEKGDFQVGASLGVELFSVGELVNVTGTSIGKGFSGVVKRHNFNTQDATHGNSLSHRAPGSIGQNQTPGRVFKGKRMAGHLGSSQVTVRRLRVVSIDVAHSLIFVSGAVPGAKGSNVVIRSASLRG